MTEKKSSGLIEKGKCLRGFGILLLCMLLASAGVWSFSSNAIYVNGPLLNQNLPLCSVENNKKQVSLTFECVDDNENLKGILESLKQKEVLATFFLSGNWAEKYPLDVKNIQSLGHELANYGDGTIGMAKLSRKKYRECIFRTECIVREITGIETKLFRAPLGSWNEQTIHTVASAGYYPVCWSIDSMDWKDYGSLSILEKICSELEAGDIIRFQVDAKYTSETVGRVIDAIKAQGFEMVPAGKLIFSEVTE